MNHRYRPNPTDLSKAIAALDAAIDRLEYLTELGDRENHMADAVGGHNVLVIQRSRTNLVRVRRDLESQVSEMHNPTPHIK